MAAAGTHTVPVTTTPEERQQIGEQIRRYRQSALVWCYQATVAVALHHSLEHSLRTSTAALPTIEELMTPDHLALVEHWRQLARSPALGEHDFDAGLGHGRLDAQQRQTVIGDIAAIVRALVVLDQRYANIPGSEKLGRPDRLGWSALACALDASPRADVAPGTDHLNLEELRRFELLGAAASVPGVKPRTCSVDQFG